MSLTLLHLPEETVSEIARILSYRDVVHLAISCRSIMNSLVKYNLMKGILATYQLSVEQLEVVEKLRQSSVDILILQAPPSMGKTSIILEYLLGKSSSLEKRYEQEKGIGIVVVPQNLFTNWVKEIKQSFPSFLDEENPKMSQILLYNHKYDNHYDYVHERKSTMVRVIICSYTGDNGYYKNLLDYPGLREFVFDEAQNKSEIKTIGDVPRILMSANHIGGTRSKTKTLDRIILTHEVIRSVIPESTERMTTDSLPDTIKVMLRKHDKIVVFLHRKDDKKLISNSYGKDVRVFFFDTKKSIPCITEFDEYQGKAILVGTLRTLGTGHNLRGDACIIHQSHNTSPAMILQAKSRLLRISNPNDHVDTVFVVEDKGILATGRFRIAMARLLEDKYYSKLHRYRNGYSDEHQGKVEKAFVKYGLVNSLSDMPDLCVVFYYLADKFFTDHDLGRYVRDKGEELVESGYFNVEVWKKMALSINRSPDITIRYGNYTAQLKYEIHTDLYDHLFK